MVLIIILAAVFGFMYLTSRGKVSSKRCWDKPPGESKVHHWVLREAAPGAKQRILICRDCGQSPGGE